MKTRFLPIITALGVFCCVISAAFADTRTEKQIAPGATLLEIRRNYPDGNPLAVYVLRIDRSAKNLSIAAMKGQDHVIGIASPRTMGEGITGDKAEVIAAINADFYNMEKPFAGVPCGMIVRNGELMCSPMDWPSLGFDKDGNPRAALITFQGGLKTGDKSLAINQVNRTREKGNVVSLFTSSFGASTQNGLAGTDVIVNNITPALPLRPGVTYSGTVSEVKKNITDDVIPADAVILSGGGSAADFLANNTKPGSALSFTAGFDGDWNQMTQSLGGWPIMLHNGQVQSIAKDEYLTERRHARSSMGWNDRYIYIVAVDAYEDNYSVGMDMPELVAFMQELGCTEAINMDGGGSTGLAIRGDYVNHISDGMDREVSSGWAVLNTAQKESLGKIQIWPQNVSVLSGSHVQFTATGTTADGTPIQVSPGDVKWSLEGVDASVLGFDPDVQRESVTPLNQPKAVLGSVDTSGLYTSANVFRSGLITAKVGKLSAVATINIWEKPAALSILPVRRVLRPGERLHLSVVATDRAGQPMTVDASSVTWKTEGGKIRRDGTFTAPKSGSVKVTAVVAGVSASVSAEIRK